jgi:hypothetical protein
MQATQIKQHVQNNVLHIDVQHMGLYVLNAHVQSITMHIEEDNEGDLAVNWTQSATATPRASMQSVMEQFYWERAFAADLQHVLTSVGFSAAAAADVSGSEWGMQDEGRASYDAALIAREARAAQAA